MQKIWFLFLCGAIAYALVHGRPATAGNHEMTRKEFTREKLDDTPKGPDPCAELPLTVLSQIDPRVHDASLAGAGPSRALRGRNGVDIWRNALEILPPGRFAHAAIDGSGVHRFSYLEARVRKKSPGERMGPGCLTAVAAYLLRSDYQPDLTSDPPLDNSRENGFSYSVSATIQIPGLGSESAQPFVFDFSSDPIPVGVTDLYLAAVFRGSLGDGAQQAVAVGISDLNEPQHLVFWNNTDYFLLNGVPRKAGEIENDPHVETYGHIYPYAFTESIAFAATRAELASAPPSFVIQDLPPGRYSRVIVLMPGGPEYWVLDHILSTPFASFPGHLLDDHTWEYPFPATINQQTSDGEWLKQPVYTVRNVTQHQMAYFIRDYPEFMYTPEAFPAPAENSLGPYPISCGPAAGRNRPSEGLVANLDSEQRVPQHR